MADDITLFDRAVVRRHRDRAASTIGAHDFLHREIADQLADRLRDIKRDFVTALDLGGGHGVTSLDPRPALLVTADLSEALLRRAGAPSSVAAVVADEEFLPFADGAFDLIASTLSLHWVNDLPGALIQIRRALKPDGLFLAPILGGDTLVELRRAFLEAEAESTGGSSPHTSPVADVADAGALLQRAGFALPVVDTDTITVTYDAMMKGIEMVKPGVRLGDIGHAIQSYAESFQYGVVRDYCGHGLGKVFHAPPNVLHFGKPGTGALLEEGMFFTIEPMINIGDWRIKIFEKFKAIHEYDQR